MNGPRELFAALLRLATASTAAIFSVTVWMHGHLVYPVTSTVESQLYRFNVVMQQNLLGMEQVIMGYVLPVERFVMGYVLTAEQVVIAYVQTLEHLVLPLFNDMAMATFSTMDAMTVVAIYSVYVWTDVVIQTVQSAMTLPSVELSIEGDLPGGIAVWLVVVFALVTYAFVYRQYPSHQEWVGTVLSFVLPLLTRSLWKSD